MPCFALQKAAYCHAEGAVQDGRRGCFGAVWKVC